MRTNVDSLLVSQEEEAIRGADLTTAPLNVSAFRKQKKSFKERLEKEQKTLAAKLKTCKTAEKEAGAV